MIMISLLVAFAFSLPAIAEELDMKFLETGEPVVWTDLNGNVKKAKGSILINAPIDECWKVMIDHNAWSEWAPGVKYNRIITRMEKHVIVEYGMDMLLFTAYMAEDVEENEQEKALYCRQLTNEEVKKYREMGFSVKKPNCTKDQHETHKLEAYGDKTIWTFTMDMDLKVPVPKMVENFACRDMAPAFLKAAKARIESNSH